MKTEQYNLVIKKDNVDNTYLFLQDKNGDDIFFNNEVVRLIHTRDKALHNTLGEVDKRISINFSKKEIGFKGYLGYNINTYKLKGDGGYWQAKIDNEYWNLILQQFKYEKKQLIAEELEEAEKELEPINKRLEQDEIMYKKLGGGFKNAHAKGEHDKDFTASWKLEDKIYGLRWSLKFILEDELKEEEKHKKYYDLWLTNPYHVEELKTKIKNLKLGK